ncbi:MAG TPA: signal peptidase II [Noviherbaspirillum sp.]|uniref:signal peptidase II n=1 Tax=Noviherbaspirillum sp. TaxID=1926288 RepID=UPI002B45F0B9|nr:signal peptidase II [Noviherbaspirillum sp.]HJV85451.1 signal peptidase II [Noviherbaspirillum sp.]
MAKQKSFKSLSARPSSSLTPWLGIAAIIILIDQITKVVMNKLFVFGESRPVTSFFNLVLAHNTGAAFSFLANQSGWQRYVFAGIAAAAVVFIMYLLKRHAGQRMFCWALAMILGGAVGNLIDRIVYGHVIDFLDFYVGTWHWPAFNVADMAIVGGAGLFVLDELRRVGK